MFALNVLLTCLVHLCLLVGQISPTAENDLSSIDVFEASKIDVNYLRFMHVDEGRTEFGKINDLLVERTKSVDPDTNLDIVLEQLLLDYKSKLPTNSRPIQAKRLFLSLSTLNKENECSRYGYLIISKNLDAMQTKVSSIKNGDKMRRIDEILAHHIRRHIDDCKRVYLKNFDVILKSLDKDEVNRVDKLLDKAIGSLTSDENFKDKDTNYVERLYSLASKEGGQTNGLEPSYIHDCIRDSAKADPNNEFSQLLGDGQRGLLRVRSEKLFDKLYSEYIVKPCEYFRQKLGPNVFKPIAFDIKFGQHQIQFNRVDFYETWLKYQLCHFDGSSEEAFKKYVEYLEDNFS